MSRYNRGRVRLYIDPAENMSQQEFKRECDINVIMAKYQKQGVLTHINTHGLEYGDFTSPGDFQTAMETIKNAEQMFSELPSKAREYYHNDPARFLEACQDPEHIHKLRELGLALGPYPKEPAPEVAPEPTDGP